MKIIHKLIVLTLISLFLVCNKENYSDSEFDLNNLKDELDLEGKTSALIDSLVNVSEYGIGFHPFATFIAFMATDNKINFDGGIIGTSIPKTNIYMQEIVKRGAIAVPYLLKHLNDNRPTKLTVGDSCRIFGAQIFGNEYCPRNPNSKYISMSNFFKAKRIKGRYTLKVGDICFCLIGQIVNREFIVVRYQPTNILIVNSPVESQALYNMIYQDWNSLNKKEHLNHLMQDLRIAKNETRLKGAYERLKYYYPAYVNKLMINDMNDAILRAKDLYEILKRN